MPGTHRVEEVSTLRRYTELIESLMGPGEPLWYRGLGKSSNRLVPSLFRHPITTAGADLIGLEQQILQRFRERSIPYQPGPQISDDWGLLFLMQHFGVPTRLLDWTENPYIGLYFALTSARLDPATLVASEPAAIWILQPQAWNRHSLRDISYTGGILSLGSEPLQTFAPKPDPSYMRTAPVAMYGLHNSPRIVAQRGVFTIFGKAVDPLDDLQAAEGYPDDSLTEVLLPADAIKTLRDSLFAIGFTDSVVYPDLGGLAQELKRFFGFQL